MNDTENAAPRRRGRQKKLDIQEPVDTFMQDNVSIDPEFDDFVMPSVPPQASSADYSSDKPMRKPTQASSADYSSDRPIRKPMRESMRESDLARAERRAAEILGAINTLDDGVDEFRIDRDMVPEGWSYEWKRKTVMGQEDVGYQTALARSGWEPVDVNKDSKHRALMGADWKGQTIERKGMILMERPKSITDEARRLELRRARGQVQIKEEQLTAAPPGQFERTNQDSSLAKVKKGYEPMPIPEK